MSTLFISHSSRDNDKADELKEALEGQGYEELFLDKDPETGIPAGANWERKLYTSLRACRAVVALVSKDYLASQWCFAELALARMEGKDLFSLQIEDTEIPSILSADQVIDLRTDPETGYAKLWKGFEAKGILPETRRAWTTGQCPYPGLRAFDESDAPIFFGRDKEVREGVDLLNRVRRQGHPRMVMVLGSSGSGKSSLARAGIVPQLKLDAARWAVVGPFRPGRRPASALAGAFSQAFEDADQTEPWSASRRQRQQQEILTRLGLRDEPTADDEEAAPAPGSAAEGAPATDAADELAPAAQATGAPRSAREKLREALLAVETDLAGNEQVARSVDLLKRYLEGSPEAPARAEGPPAGAPGGNPLAALAGELRVARGTPEAKVVILIDQFEELLGHEDKGDDHPANLFLILLKEAIEGDDNPPLALGTMRSDFLGVLQRSAPLRGVGFKSLSVGPMSEQGMRDVISKPAVQGGIDLEDELTHLLLSETGTADALPLLAFTLRAMWDKYHGTRRFDVAGYEALGGLHRAIAKAAEETLRGALDGGDEGTERDLRIAFLSLARPAAEGGGWARQPASLEEMPERARPVIEQFVKERLLRTREDGTIEVAHEALFRSWETLRGWLAANAEGLHLRSEISKVAQEWQAAESGKDKKEYLWHGGRLSRALELQHSGVLQLSETDTTFIEASQSEQTRLEEEKEAQRQAELARERELAAEQKKRAAAQARLARIAMIGLAIVAVLLVAVYGFYRKAEAARLEAEDQTRVAVARNLLERDPTRAALVLLELGDPENTVFAAQLMADALREPLALVELRGHADHVTYAEFNPAGDRIVTASADGTARIWRLREGPREPLAAAPAAAAATTPAAAPASWSFVAEAPPLEHDEPLLYAAFEPLAGETLLTVTESRARLWNADGSRLLRADGTGRQVELEHPGRALAGAAFSPVGDRIVTISKPADEGSESALAHLWTADGEPILDPETAAPAKQLVLDHGELEMTAVAFGPGGHVVTGDRTSTAWLWRADGEQPPLRIPPLDDRGEARFAGHGEALRSVAFSPNGDVIATAATDDTARLWRLDGTPQRYPEPRQLKVVELLHAGDVYRVAFSPDGGRLLTASDDGTARLWNSDGSPALSADGSRQIVLRHDAEINSAVFSADGERIVTASRDGTARVWSSAGGSEPVVLPHQWTIRAIAGPHGEILTATDDPKVVVWRSDPEARLPALPSDRLGSWTAEDPISLSGGHQGRVAGVDASPSGDRLLTAGPDGTARLWRAGGDPMTRTAPDGTPAQITLRHGAPDDPAAQMNRAAFDADGARIVTASGDGTARLWTDGGAPIRGGAGAGDPIVLTHKAGVNDAAFSPAGEDLVLTASHDHTARLWTTKGDEKATLEHDREVVSAAFSRAGDRVVTAAGSQAHLWETDGTRVGKPRQHDGPVLTAAFGPLGERFATGSSDFTIRVWQTGGDRDELVLRTDNRSYAASVVFLGESGDRLLTTARYPGARIWRISSELLTAKIRAVTSLCLDEGFRRATLRETAGRAERRAARCGTCLQEFQADASRRGLVGAFEAYGACFK